MLFLHARARAVPLAFTFPYFRRAFRTLPRTTSLLAASNSRAMAAVQRGVQRERACARARGINERSPMHLKIDRPTFEDFN